MPIKQTGCLSKSLIDLAPLRIAAFRCGYRERLGQCTLGSILGRGLPLRTGLNQFRRMDLVTLERSDPSLDISLELLVTGQLARRANHRRCIRVGRALTADIPRIKKRIEPVVVLLRQRVVLVIVALGTLHGQAHEYRRNRVDLVGDIGDAVFLGDRATLVRVHAVAQKAGCQPRLIRRIWKQVPGQLFDNELVVRHVLVVRVDHPFTPEPHVSVVIDRKAIRIRIPRRVEPGQGHALSEMRRGKQTINRFLICVATLIREIRIDLFDRRRKAGEVQCQTTQ